MGTNDNESKLPLHYRVILGVFAIPSLFLAFMLGSMIVKGDFQDIQYFEWVYSLVGMLALYISVTGKRLF